MTDNDDDDDDDDADDDGQRRTTTDDDDDDDDGRQRTKTDDDGRLTTDGRRTTDIYIYIYIGVGHCVIVSHRLGAVFTCLVTQMSKLFLFFITLTCFFESYKINYWGENSNICFGESAMMLWSLPSTQGSPPTPSPFPPYLGESAMMAPTLPAPSQRGIESCT